MPRSGKEHFEPGPAAPEPPRPMPFLTKDQMIEVDRAMMEDFRIDLIQMMENAGRNLAHLARRRFLGGDPIRKTIIILAGTGGNGGGALVAARRLHNWGAMVRVIIAKGSDAFTPVAAHQLDILRRMDVAISRAEEVKTMTAPELIIDGLIGYSLSGPPRDSVASLIDWANEARAPILALDTPSGVDTTTGRVFVPAIRATATMTLALPKEGLRAPAAADYVGELYLADISVPPALYTSSLNLSVGPVFAEDDVIRLR